VRGHLKPRWIVFTNRDPKAMVRPEARGLPRIFKHERFSTPWAARRRFKQQSKIPFASVQLRRHWFRVTYLDFYPRQGKRVPGERN
jgi:hypothetical protein